MAIGPYLLATYWALGGKQRAFLVEMRARQKFSADLESLSAMRHFVRGAAENSGPDAQTVADMVLAVNEATTNVVLHGYRGEPGTIEIEVGSEGDDLVVCLRDWSPPFDPAQVPDRDVAEPLEQRPLGGLGIFMMRRLTDKVIYRSRPDGSNELILIKEGARSS